MAGFVSAHPSVNLSIMGRSSPEVVALVESGKADLGLVYDSGGGFRHTGILSLFDDDMALIVRHDSSLSGPGPGRAVAAAGRLPRRTTRCAA